jgi:hypothetical protein
MSSVLGIADKNADGVKSVTADPTFRGLQHKYDVNANGRMIWSATTASTQLADAVYDGEGHRIATKVGGGWNYMVYDVDGKLIAEYGGGDGSRAGGVHYQFPDHQGSVRAVMNENGRIVERHDYPPFGEEVGAVTGQTTVEKVHKLMYNSHLSGWLENINDPFNYEIDYAIDEAGQ